ncbi:coiled-coil domain-containing protein [Spirillospora sp. CA-294931]|uniref:coiled-coil domain-containing protein n=1 Tax=Spirillospora sp. CA-294931 TaxID=3240042 RepID=UPI003D8D33CD
METPNSTRRARKRLLSPIVALVALTGALPLAMGPAAPPAMADPGDSSRFARLNKQIEKLDKAYGGDLAKLKDAQHDAKQALDRAKDLKGDLEASRKIVAQMAATQYMTGGTDPTVSVLSADDPSLLLNNATLANHVAQNKAGKVQQIQKLVNDQEKARLEAQKKVDGLEKNIKDLARQKARIRALVKKYKPESPSSGMGGVTPRMKKVYDTIDLEFGPFPMIGCVRSTGDPQDHALGKACDFMVTTGGRMASGTSQTLGDRAAAYAIANADKLGVKYVIWRQRIYDMRSPGWDSMSNRGGVTANHYDHVHISVF